MERLPASQYAALAAESMTEQQFTAHLLETGHLYGWLMSFDRPARQRINGVDQYRTPFTGDVKPDGVIVHPDRGLYTVELKAGKRWKWRAGQRQFLEAAGDRGFWWHTSHVQDITAWLSGRMEHPPRVWDVRTWQGNKP